MSKWSQVDIKVKPSLQLSDIKVKFDGSGATVSLLHDF